MLKPINNNRGQAVAGILFVALLAILVGGGIFAGWNAGLFSGDSQQAVENRELSATDCESAPSISVSAVNALKKGTTVSTTNTARVNDVYVGSIPSNLQKGDDVEIHVSASNFLDTVIEEFPVSCGTNIKTTEVYATSTNTFRIFNTNNQLLTDDASANSTAGDTVQGTSASPISLEVKIDSTVDESTGDLVIVVEATNTTEVDDLKLSGSGASSSTVPEFYSPVASGSISKAFDVPALLDGESKSLTLTISPEASQTIGLGDTSIYVTAYSKQWFTDTDGTFKYGIEDADGTIKYEDTWDFDLCIAGTTCA